MDITNKQNCIDAFIALRIQCYRKTIYYMYSSINECLMIA